MSVIESITVWTLALYRRPMSLTEYQKASRSLIAELQQGRTQFQHLVAVGQSEMRVIAPDLTGIEGDIAAAAFDPEHLSDYLHSSGHGNLEPQSLSRIGFSVTYGALDARSGSMLPIGDGGIRLRLRGTSASIEPETSVVLQMSVPCATDRGYLKQLLRDIVQSWPAGLGGISVPLFQEGVRGADRASYAGQWFFYLPFPNLAKCLPPDIRHEPFANGILIETTPHMPDANNPEDVAAGKRVRDVLDEFGLVNDATYAIEGWPPDREETIYEQFITGAPANRKYTVHCINFDGYDPNRKVLLYAKLFRRLKRHPKEWGFRGWDGPVLNEAKRQVRAAAKAGGVKIEWHIGLEEPAHQVRQLIADYTNITEQQLRVIYTPLEQAKPPS
ncbi:MAG TPA: Tox-REase-5 domain-containing protein [Steroidobacter sp.]